MKVRICNRIFSVLQSSIHQDFLSSHQFFQRNLIRPKTLSTYPSDDAALLPQKKQMNTHDADNKTERFKLAMRKVPQQVVVVTSSVYQPDNERWLKRGVTCSSFCSVSVNPPIVSFCLNNGSRLGTLIETSKKFAVHILSHNQIHQGIHFSKPSKTGVCQFDSIPHVEGQGALPIIMGSLAVLVCDTHSNHEVGDNTVWYGNVTEVSVSETLQEPLIYFTRKFRSIGDEIFLKAFEDTTLPFENWTHEAHLRMAWNYIKEYGKEGAVPFIKLGIQNFNEKNVDKIKTGYHETITTFFIHLVSDAIVQSVNAEETFEAFLSQHTHLMNKDLLLEYYTQHVLFQEEAKYRFIPPDKKRLP